MDRVVRRALAASAVIALLAAGTAAADTLRADSDVLTAGLQSGRVLGDVVVGSKVEVPVRFELSCSGSAHLDPGQQLTISLSSATWPGDGSSSFVPVTLGPVPSGWPADGASCPSASTMAVQGTVALTAPSTPSGPLTVTIVFGQSIAPAGAGDKSAVTGIAAVDLTMTFVPNTPPLLSLPADMTVEGNAAGGATVGYAATASDTEDDPDPPAVCTPAAGSLFPLGSSTVDCTATDTAGAPANGSFVVTVIDTTPPTLAGVPADVSAVAADAAGATVTYAPPTASDAVDPAPVVACSPATGSLFPVGVTTVGCTATDATGNTASASFSVTVTAPVTPPPPPSPGASVVFDPPIGPDGSVRVNGQRVLPVKARVILAAGAPRFGAATLVARPCEAMFVAGAAVRVPMSWQQGAERWIGLLPTDRFPAGCFEVALELADSEAAGEAASSAAPTTPVGGFTLWVSPPAKAPKAR